MTAIEQAEPNGLFSSKNTDATWILYVDEESGVLYPVYSEHKAMSWPFIMQQTQSGEWVKASGETPEFTIEIVADGGKKKS
jgi:hypothetical protein